ncbi:MAG: sugar phosphate isomerase/epimerase family protein, partial [Anaerolineae bacterium]
PTAALRLAAAAGCDGIELVLDPWSIALGPARLRRLSDGYGLPVSALHPPLFALPGWSRSETAFARIGRYAAAVGSPLVVLHPPRPNDLEMVHGGFDRGLQAMRRAAGDAVTLTVENVAVFHPEDIGHDCVWPERVAAFAADRGLGITLDTTHLASTGQDLVAAYECVHAHVQHVHLSDFRTPRRFLDRPSLHTYVKHHQLPGAGDLDIAELLLHMRRHGYDGALTLELSPLALRLWRPRQSVSLLRRSVDFLKRELARPLPVVGASAVPAGTVLDVAQPVGG